MASNNSTDTLPMAEALQGVVGAAGVPAAPPAAAATTATTATASTPPQQKNLLFIQTMEKFTFKRNPNQSSLFTIPEQRKQISLVILALCEI